MPGPDYGKREISNKATKNIPKIIDSNLFVKDSKQINSRFQHMYNNIGNMSNFILISIKRLLLNFKYINIKSQNIDRLIEGVLSFLICTRNRIL